MATQIHEVARAQPGEVSDSQLGQLRLIAHGAQTGAISRAEAEWLLSCAGPLLDELAERRKANAELAAQDTEHFTGDASNVITLVRDH